MRWHARERCATIFQCGSVCGPGSLLLFSGHSPVPALKVLTLTSHVQVLGDPQADAKRKTALREAAINGTLWVLPGGWSTSDNLVCAVSHILYS